MAACSSAAKKKKRPTAFGSTSTAICGAGWGMGPALDGVKVFNPAGKAIGFIALPERAANVCFGGRYRNRLFMAASHSIYSLYVNTQGVAGG
jgi:gluconolactonase